MSKGNDGTPETSRKRKKPEISFSQSVLECPICLEVFAGKVFQCQEGHVICEQCKAGLPSPKRCPSCRGTLDGGIRSRVLEEMAGQVRVPCSFEGCGFTGLNKDMPNHRKACDHRPYTCPMSGCSWSGGLKDVEGHLASVHSAGMRTCQGKNPLAITLANPTAFENAQWGFIINRGSERHLLCGESNSAAKTYKFGVLHLGLSSPFQYSLTASGQSRSRSFTCPIRSIRQNNARALFDSDDCLTIIESSALYMSTGRSDAAPKDLKLCVSLQIE